MKQFIEGLGGLFNKTPEDLASLYEGDNLKEEDAQKYFRELLSAKVQEVTRNQIARGKIEAAKEWKKTLGELVTAKGVEIDGTIDGPAMIQALVEQLENKFAQSQGDGKQKELTKEQIEQLPIFKELKNALVAPFQAKIQELETNLTKEQQAQMIRANKEAVFSAAFNALESSNWIEGEDAATKQLRRQTIQELLHLKTGGFSKVKVDQNKVFLLDDNGEMLVDELQRPIQFDDYIKKINPFGFHAVDPKKGSSNPSNYKPGSTTTGKTGSLDERLRGVTSNEERKRIMEEYRAEAAK